LSQFGARLCIAMVVLIMSGCASAPRHGGRGGPGGPRMSAMDGRFARPIALLFVSMDADHDLSVTSTELAEGLKVEWARADKDHNGSLSAFEMSDWCSAVLGDPDATPGRLSLDTDVNGVVSREEFETGLKKEFAALDRNADGKLDRAELLVKSAQGDAGEVGGNGQRPSGGQSGGGGRGGGGRHRPY
jgi:Ca2+-binding EF-hand superfamily protein